MPHQHPTEKSYKLAIRRTRSFCDSMNMTGPLVPPSVRRLPHSGAAQLPGRGDIGSAGFAATHSEYLSISNHLVGDAPY